MLRLGILFLILPLFVGCASVNVTQMVPDADKYGTQHPATVALLVEPGTTDGTEWYSGTIETTEFEKAIQQSLTKTRVFKSLVSKETAEYLLYVKLTVAASHPGFNMNAWVNANWSLIHRGSGTLVWEQMIKGKGHATLGDSIGGNKRQVIALERGAKANIDEALKIISSLNLSKFAQ